MEMDFNCLPDQTYLVMMNVFGYMVYPNPDIKYNNLRQSFVAQLVIKNFYSMFKSIDAEYAFQALNYCDESKSLANRRVADICDHTKEGYIAGMVFLNFLEIQKSGIRPTVNKAKVLTYETAKKLGVSSVTKISSAWNKYRWSSHIWASLILSEESFLDESNFENLDVEKWFGLIIELGEKLKNNLQCDLWNFPKGHHFPKMECETLGISEKKLTVLSSYKSKKYFPNF